MTKIQHGIGSSSSSSCESAIKSTQSDLQSCSSTVGNRLVRFRCSQCSHAFESNKNLLNKLSELKCKHDEEMKETRNRAEKEFEQKLLEYRTDLEREAEKRLDSLNLELRLKLVKSEEENISLKQENIKILKNYTIKYKIQIEKYNELKESYEKKMVSPSNDLESMKMVHNKEMKELAEKLEKEWEKKLMEQRIDLEAKAKSKLNQLRNKLTKCLDRDGQPENSIIEDDEVMIISESFTSKLHRKKKTISLIGPDCEFAGKKRKLSTSFDQPNASTSGPRDFLSSIGREFIESNDKLGYTEIPDNHCAVRICSICRWVEKISHSNYYKHFLDNHSSSFIHSSRGKRADLFKELILDYDIYHSLKDKYQRDEISDEKINLNCYRISKNSRIVRLCSICQYIEPIRKIDQFVHFKEHQASSKIEGTVNSIYKTVVMKKKKFKQLRSKGKRK